jgi:phospholipid/cholesterol/gamma-HCH transport system substrate-binding protein
MDDVDRLTTELNVAVDSINAMLAPENAERVTSILTHVDGLTRDANDLLAGLGGSRRRIDAIAANLEVTTRNMNEFSKQIRDDPSLLIRGREAQGEN